MGLPPPWLHGEVARRMSERLAVLKQAPRCVVDWGAHLGGSAAALEAACPRAQRIAAEVFVAAAPPQPVAKVAAAPLEKLGPSALARGGVMRWWSWRPWQRHPAAGARHSSMPADERELADGAADLLWSNMVLHHLVDPQAAFGRWRRLLAVDGILMFSTLGPGTLQTLAALYREAGWGRAQAPFVDMHDLGDMLVHAGFADPVMDQEIVRLSWGTPREALAELRRLGGNADPARHAGLRTPRWKAALETALARRASASPGGRLTLEFEVVYGHAVRPLPRLRVAAETAVSVGDLRGMLRRPGGAGGSHGPNGPTR
jgi:malonyl-CoA O-methyltransferase